MVMVEPADAATDRDAAALSPYRGLLRLHAWRQRQYGDAECDQELQPWGHGVII